MGTPPSMSQWWTMKGRRGLYKRAFLIQTRHKKIQPSIISTAKYHAQYACFESSSCCSSDAPVRRSSLTMPCICFCLFFIFDTGLPSSALFLCWDCAVCSSCSSRLLWLSFSHWYHCTYPQKLFHKVQISLIICSSLSSLCSNICHPLFDWWSQWHLDGRCCSGRRRTVSPGTIGK